MKEDRLPEDVPHRADPAVRELVLQAQAGSGDACRALCDKYRPLLESSVARFATAELSRQERADLREEADRVFISAITTYDTDQDAVDFGLYAKICLRNGLVSEWRRMEARRRLCTVSLPDHVAANLSVGREDPASRVVEEERFRALCRTVRSHLSDFENQVWWQYVTGVPVPTIAEGLGRDERAIHNAIYRIRHKLRERLIPPTD